MITLIDLIPLALLGGVLGLDVVSFPQAMISRPLVAATLGGALLGQASSGLLLGAALELIALETLPFGASRYPEWGSASVVGGAIFASHPHIAGRCRDDAWRCWLRWRRRGSAAGRWSSCAS